MQDPAMGASTTQSKVRLLEREWSSVSRPCRLQCSWYDEWLSRGNPDKHWMRIDCRCAKTGSISLNREQCLWNIGALLAQCYWRLCPMTLIPKSNGASEVACGILEVSLAPSISSVPSRDDSKWFEPVAALRTTWIEACAVMSWMLRILFPAIA